MKKTKTLLPLLLVLAIVITTIAVFTGTVGADTTSAVYSTQTFATNATYGFITTYGAATTTEDDFEALAANLAANAPTENTFYKLTLTEDVILKNPVNIAVNEFTEVVIDLDGHKLTTECGSAAFVITGSGGIVRIVGSYTNEGKWAPVVYNQTAGELATLSAGSDSMVILKNLSIDMSGLEPGTSLLTLSSGDMTINSCEVTYNSAKTGSMSMITATGGTANIRNSVIDLSSSDITTTAISLTGANGYLEKSVIKADRAIYSDVRISNILSVATDIEAAEPFTVGNPTSRIDILGGRITATGGKIVSGPFDKSLVTFYYGDGEMVVSGEDPASYSLQADCVFTENASGDFVMSYTGSTLTNKVMMMYATVGTAPVVEFGEQIISNLAKGRKIDGTTDNAFWVKQTDSTAIIRTCIDDQTSSSAWNATLYANEYIGVIYDFNGYDVETTCTTTKEKHDIYGNINLYIDGADVNGKKGSYTTHNNYNAGENPLMIRTMSSSSSRGATVYSTLVVTDTTFVAKFVPASNNNVLLTVQTGDITVDGCAFVYDGGANPKGSGNKVHKFISLGTSGNPGNSFGRVINTEFTNTSTAVFKYLYAIEETNSSQSTLFVDGVTASGYESFVASGYASGSGAASGGVVYIRNSDITTSGITYSGKGEVHVYDTKTTSHVSGRASNCPTAVFYYGEGKNVICTNGLELKGTHTSEEGYGIGMTDIGIYKVLDASMCPSVTLPKIFQNGMVLQRNKPINIFGYGNTDGSVVEVSLGGNTAYATVQNGEWCATLPAMEAAFNQTIKIVEHVPADNLIEIKNVNIGEVWVMAGQSNANLEAGFLEDSLEYAELANALQNIRIYKSGNGYTLEEQKEGSGTWYTEVTPSDIKSQRVSAIGYVAAAKIAAELGDDVPVAIMHIARGSTRIKTWLDYETLKEVSPSAANEYDYYLNVKGSLPESAHGANAVGTVIYNNLIAPIEGYAVAGVMWYQGESDSTGKYFGAHNEEYITWAQGQGTYQTYEEDADNCYTEFFYALEKVLRRAFGNDSELPVYVMQLAPFPDDEYAPDDLYDIKMEQYEMCKGEPNTHLVSLATDGPIVGGGFFNTALDPDLENSTVEGQSFIHPIRKSTVGIRTADLILANEYGIKYADVYTHPEPISAVASNGVLTVTFDTDLQYFYGSSAQGFEVYNGTDWVAATGYIDGNKVILTAEGVTDMTKVRYGCGETLMELRDGTVIEVRGKLSPGGKNYTIDAEAKTLTVTYNGNTYVINADTTDMIRTLDYGNITNASGVPLVIFALDITTGVTETE